MLGYFTTNNLIENNIIAGSIPFRNGTFKAILLNSSAPVGTSSTYSNVSSYQPSGSGYTASSIEVTITGGDNQVINLGTASFTASGGSITARYIAYYENATGNLCGYCLLDSNNVDVTITDGNTLNVQDVNGAIILADTYVHSVNNNYGDVTITASGLGAEIATNKVTSISSSSTDTQYPSAKAVYDTIVGLPITITESDVTVTRTRTKGVAPYNPSYYYTDITINDLTEAELTEGIILTFIVTGDLVVSSSYRNVRIRFGSTGNWYPVMDDGEILSGYVLFKVNYIKQYAFSHKIYANGSFELFTDSNTTYIPSLLGFGYGVCSTESSTLAKEVTISSYKLLVNGYVSVKFENAVLANSTLTILGSTSTSVPIYYNGTAIVDNIIKSGDTALFVYNGTQYDLISINTYISALTTHTSNTSNPHSVTKAQVGLGNVPNTDFTSSVSTLQTDVDNIEALIPNEAVAVTNILADKAFVNSSISTNTATFRGTSASGLTEAQFLAWANGLTKTNNDYVFWNTTDTDGNVVFKRYKYNGTDWVYEYSLNNSSFTASQWASINSGITSGLVDDYSDHIADTDIHVTSTDKSTWNGKQDVLTAGSNIQINGTTISATDTIYTLPTASDSTKGGVKIGSNLTMNGEVLSATDTTYSVVTTSANGLMSSTDKSKLDGIQAGAKTGTVTSVAVKVNGTVKGTVTTSGTIDLGTIGGSTTATGTYTGTGWGSNRGTMVKSLTFTFDPDLIIVAVNGTAYSSSSNRITQLSSNLVIFPKLGVIGVTPFPFDSGGIDTEMGIIGQSVTLNTSTHTVSWTLKYNSSNLDSYGNATIFQVGCNSTDSTYTYLAIKF